MPFRLKYRYPLRLQIATLFTLLIVFIGSVIVIFSNSQMTRLTEINTNQQYQKTGEAVAAELDAVTRAMRMSVNLLAGTTIADAVSLEQRMMHVSKFIDTLLQNDYASSIYVAYPDGDFFMLRRITADNRRFFHVPENVRWVVQSSQFVAGKPEKRFTYINDRQEVSGVKTIAAAPFDPRTRHWFIQALKTADLIVSPNYRFQATGETGFTYSRLADNQRAVIGLDVSLASLSEFLKQQGLPAGSQAAIVNAANETIASFPSPDWEGKGFTPRERSPVLNTLLGLPVEKDGTSRLFKAGAQLWYGSVVNINNHGNDYRLVIATPSVLLTAGANAIRNNATVIALTLLLLSLPVVWYFSLRISRPLVRLCKDAEAISNLRFDGEGHEHSVIREVDDLHRAMTKMKSTLKRFISIGSILSVRDNFPQQMQGLLIETMNIAGMNGGMIYLADKSQKIFTPVAVNREGQTFTRAEMDVLQCHERDLSAFLQIREGRSMSGIFGSQPGHAAVPGPLRAFLQPYLPVTYIVVPMQTHDGHLLGFLLLFHFSGMNPEHQATTQQLVNALIGSISVAIETQFLLQEQKNLLNAFIELIAGAIDTKSAYTGGHCQRVPEITKMLARAAVAAKEGPFADFSLSEDEWKELHTACWLHDCGKITTPEFVVDKATKLELIYDRIHEIRMRFEVLKREKEIASLRSRMAPSSLTEADTQLEETLRQLDNDFYFIAQCNIGGEFLSDDALARIRAISDYRWTRTLDDTSGVSSAELARKMRQPAPPLPAQEPLLADKEEHVVYRDQKNHLPENYDFRVREPEYLYNYGEIYNLSIRRGTLNDEERYKINEHIMQTIIMLRKLPFPRTMANVPEIAGGHHERMDGKGYPYQLREEQMSIPVKMMAIADVFEALTAADRPYKPGKRLSEALNIMAMMVNESHLNRDLFILFLQSGVWKDYATAFLQAADVDEVDVRTLLGKVAPV